MQRFGGREGTLVYVSLAPKETPWLSWVGFTKVGKVFVFSLVAPFPVLRTPFSYFAVLTLCLENPQARFLFWVLLE